MNYEQMSNNRATLTGIVVSQPQYSHEVFGEGFYETKLSVPRLSMQKDILPITISERLISECRIEVGSTISVSGQFRSYNKIEDGRSRLMLTLFVREVLEVAEDANPNIIELNGYICKPPVYRTTPFNREICDVLVAVNRAYNKSDYIPCIAWGRNARYVKTAEVGSRIAISGRIQSREYQKVLESGETVLKTAYEISVCRVSVEKAEAHPDEAGAEIEDNMDERTAGVM